MGGDYDKIDFYVDILNADEWKFTETLIDGSWTNFNNKV